MLSTLSIVLPVFALILTGWLARRFGALGPQATRELNRFVVWLALPALLFDIVASTSFEALWQPGFIIAFGGGCVLIYTLTLGFRLFQRAKLADAAIDGLNASYANTGYMGFPLLLAAFGLDGLTPALIATILTVCVIFALAIILIEAGIQSDAEGANGADIARKTALSLAKNPLLISPLLGGVFLATGWTLPVPVETFLDMLGGAASPCALIALGLFLAGATEASAPRDIGSISLLSVLKLIGQPVVTWVIAGPVLGLPPLALHSAVLIAALPTGTGSFMLAEFYEREAGLTGRVVLITTLLSVFTLSAYLAYIGQ